MQPFQLHIASGRIVVIDPMFIDYAQRPLRGRVVPVLENELYLNASGFDKLLALEAIAMGRTNLKEALRTIAYYDLAPLDAGSYSFKVQDIRSSKSQSHINPTEEFSVDSGQILVFDFEFLEGVLKHFEWKLAYKNGHVDRKREREHSQLIAGCDAAYVQVQSPGINRGVEFIGDGEYYFPAGTFKPLPI